MAYFIYTVGGLVVFFLLVITGLLRRVQLKVAPTPSEKYFFDEEEARAIERAARKMGKPRTSPAQP
jgi:hypothetical protein